MVSQEEGVEGNRSISKAGVCAGVPSTQAGGSWERYAGQGSFEKGQGGAQPVTPVRAEPGLGRALHAPLILEGRKEGEEAWTLEPSGEGNLGFQGLPQEASPTPPQNLKQGAKSHFHAWTGRPLSGTRRDQA